MVNSNVLVIMIMLAITPITNVFAEPIMITQSPDRDRIIFDGIWTDGREWKSTSLDEIRTDQGIIYLRTAHQGNFVYVLLDVTIDTHLDKETDKAVICFDTTNDKTEFANSDDYCFIATLGKKTGSTLQGGSSLDTNDFQNIQNPDGFIGMGGISDENDRYSKIPHASYEFRIPTDLIGRSDNYGYYVGIYDDFTKTTYSWPSEIVLDEFKIPSPKLWGEIISPDKSLPEFDLPFLALVSSLVLILVITRIKNKVKLQV